MRMLLEFWSNGKVYPSSPDAPPVGFSLQGCKTAETHPNDVGQAFQPDFAGL